MKIGDTIEYHGKLFTVFSVENGKIRARRQGCIVVINQEEIS